MGNMQIHGSGSFDGSEGLMVAVLECAAWTA